MEVPHLDAFSKDRAADGLRVVSFGSDFSSYSCSQWVGLGASYPIIDDRSSEFWRLFGSGAVPRNVIMDTNGKIHYSKIGYNESDVTAILDQLLITQSIDLKQTPSSARLISAYPNPFNAGTLIQFELDHAQNMELLIFDQQGRAVKTLSSEARPHGQFSIQWTGQDDSGNAMPSGVYLVSLITENAISSKKIILLK